MKRAIPFSVIKGSNMPCPDDFEEDLLLLASRSGSEALMLRAIRLSHVSVRTCELWQNG